MASKHLECQFCGRKDFKSAKGLTQHQNRSQCCRRQLSASIYGATGAHFAPAIPNRSATTTFCSKRQKIASHCLPTRDFNDEEDIDIASFVDFDDNTSEASLSPDEAQINTEIRAIFRTYVSFACKHLLPFSRAEATAMRLLLKLRKTKASLQTYESIMEWHLTETQKLQNWQSLADCEDHISREKMFKSLKKRYNIDDEKFLQVKPHILPHSRTKVNIVLNDAQCVLQSLLMDPRISDEDYIFFNNDPFQPPPEEVTAIKDLNTGQSYRQTYARLVQNRPNHILLPALFYMDGANAGHFVDLPLTAVKISLGIFSRKA